MKTTLLMILLTTAFGSRGLFAQIVANAYIEKTHVSFKSGTAIGYQNRYSWEYGAFYQTANTSGVFMTEQAKFQLPKYYEKSFGGLYFTAPLIYGNDLSLKANVRTGVTNGENFTITPSILGSYEVFSNATVSAGIGVRAFRPTWQAMITLKL